METERHHLPDVADERSTSIYTPLNWVGMSGIEMPVQLPVMDGGHRVAAKVDAHVSLDQSPSRGIHMSRLYLLVQESLEKEELSLQVLKDLTEQFLQSHQGLSGSARVRVHLQWPVLRKALVSSNQSWRTYPVTLSVEKKGQETRSYLEVEITYSSTCPASAALSRRVIQENFRQQFGGQNLNPEAIEEWLGSVEGISATPHAQRSFARVKVATETLSVVRLIDLIEEALQTPVQGAVKRADEQEFARRNGQNLMFCEDAARRVQKVLEAESQISDYRAEFEHVESLHPHSAVSVVTKGLPGGLAAN